jgi:hypothetical protein
LKINKWTTGELKGSVVHVYYSTIPVSHIAETCLWELLRFRLRWLLVLVSTTGRSKNKGLEVKGVFRKKRKKLRVSIWTTNS